MEKHYFLIHTTFNEWKSGYVRINETLEEAESHIMEYNNWYCDKGTCEIHEVNSELQVIKIRKYNCGVLFSFKKFGSKKC